MDVNELKADAAAGKLSVDRLLAVIVTLQQRIAELEAQLNSKNPTDRLDEPYSEKAEDKRKNRKPPKKPPLRRGRVTTADKIKLAQRTERVYPDDKEPGECQFSHTRVAWRLETGKAILVAYEVYRCGKLYGKPLGLLGRSEFGIEITVAIAYQVYCLGLSLDKACAVLSFFQQLRLRKSQADALLNQLARNWESEFENLCTLLANSAVVYCDETSWSINSVWAFVTEHLSVLFYGVHKDGETLAQILDKAKFAGVLVSDDAAVYQGFSQAQKCWAHLIRKAIKLTLQSPENVTYREFADHLLDLYRRAKRIAADGRLSDAGRQERVGLLDDELLSLCSTRWLDDSTEGDEVENDYRRLCNEIMRLMLAEELFTFVTTAGVDGNNNVSERQLRDDAMARKTGRTSKTTNGAKRQSIISSVLQSIGKQLEAFTLAGVIAEATRWLQRGRSCFQEMLDQQKIEPRRPSAAGKAERSLLNRLIIDVDKPKPSAAS